MQLCFFFKEKTAYEMRISDWSSDVCSSDLNPEVLKRYRLYCSLTLRVKPAITGNGTLAFYALQGYVTGVRYVLHSWKTRGVSKAEALEMLAMSFIHAGPRDRKSTRLNSSH